MNEPLITPKGRFSFCKRLHCGACFVVLEVLFFTLAIVLPAVIQNTLNNGILDMVTLSPEAMAQKSDGWMAWADTRGASSGQQMVVYFWHVTNPEDVLNGTKPILREKGPYVYDQYTWIQNISFPTSLDGFKLVQFKEWTWFVYNKAASAHGVDPENDQITIPNLGMQGVYSQEKDLAYALYHTQPEVKRLYGTQSPNDWLFGYKDPTLRLIGQEFPGVCPNTSFADAMKRKFDQIYSGADDRSLTRQYYMYQESPLINCQPNRELPVNKPCWGSPEANRLHGTDGAQFAPAGITQQGGSVTTWVDDLFRELPLYNTDNETMEFRGILLHKFKVRPEELMNAQHNNNNGQYYAYGLDGYWNITYAQGKLPTFVSQPHLLYADPLMFQYFDGMSGPAKDQHETYLGVELNTGMTLSARKRWQINFGLKPLEFPNKNHTWFEKLRMPPSNVSEYLLHPAVWMELRGDVSEDDASTFKGGVYLAQTMIRAFKWGGMTLGFLSLIGSIVAWLPLLRRPPSHSHDTQRGLGPVV